MDAMIDRPAGSAIAHPRDTNTSSDPPPAREGGGVSGADYGDILSEGFAPPTGAIGHVGSVWKLCSGGLKVSHAKLASQFWGSAQLATLLFSGIHR